MRSAAAIACWMLAFTRLSFLIGAVHHERRRQKRREVAGRERVRCGCASAPYHSAPTAASPPMNSMSGGSADIAPVIFMFVR